MPDLSAALEPLFCPTEQPDRHRTRARLEGSPAQIVAGRRPTPLLIAQRLRYEVSQWRNIQYGGASDTSRELLLYWFGQDHTVGGVGNESIPFAYYFCQREAIETLIYLYECRRIRTLSSLTASFRGVDAELAALGISPEEDAWPRYAFKIATGAGKTKIMALAMVWSYFHSIRELDSDLAKDFVMIAPGVTVFERLMEDFRPKSGGLTIFDRDPLIPPAWAADWNMEVVLQDEPSIAVSEGSLYLTNIHRLYAPDRRRRSGEPESYDWMGPTVDRNRALDVSAELRERIVQHRRLMVLNDEAHHLWDPESAWNEAIRFLHNSTAQHGGGVVAQLDFSATPKDNLGQPFKHIIVDTPLGEAVDAGIVKTPVIGQSEHLITRPHQDAGYRYEHHLLVGYKRWVMSKEEWERSGKKALMFVMAESTEAADQITHRLNTAPIFRKLNGRTINLHTNLKGRLRKRGRGVTSYFEFVESERDISDEDLDALRRLARELDDNSSPYQCIVSVLMLREGWDVRNVTTIVPLRPLNATSRILPEQTLGRGLRRMTPPGLGQPAETVTVVEHKAFASLYREELAQEGLAVEILDVDRVPRTTVTIYPDWENKDPIGLDLEIPRLSYGYRYDASIGDVTIDEVREQFNGFPPIPLGKPRAREIRYEGRHLITNEILEQMKIKLPLLSDPVGAISFYREELERSIKITGAHALLAPIIQKFIQEILFSEQVDMYDPRVVTRLGDSDVREYIRATFIPLLLRKITRRQERVPELQPVPVSSWQPYQATYSERHPVETADLTGFNLVPCNRQLEVAMTQFLDRATDVAAFAKNQGPQCLRIDALNLQGRRGLYTPDFLIRLVDGKHVVAETKGRVDRDVPSKARAALEWCKAASGSGVNWEYLYIPQASFEKFSGESVSELFRACAPSLRDLLREAPPGQLELPFDLGQAEREDDRLRQFISAEELGSLDLRARRGVEHSVMIYLFLSSKPGVGLAPVFQPLLGPVDEAAERIILQRLAPRVPVESEAQGRFFSPTGVPSTDSQRAFLVERGRALRRLLVTRSPIMPTGVLLFCMEYKPRVGQAVHGILEAVRDEFSDLGSGELPVMLREVYNFRNAYIAHETGEQLTDVAVAERALRSWIAVLLELQQLVRPVGAV